MYFRPKELKAYLESESKYKGAQDMCANRKGSRYNLAVIFSCYCLSVQETFNHQKKSTQTTPAALCQNHCFVPLPNIIPRGKFCYSTRQHFGKQAYSLSYCEFYYFDHQPNVYRMSTVISHPINQHCFEVSFCCWVQQIFQTHAYFTRILLVAGANSVPGLSN